MGKRLGDPDDPLLVSVRSGAKFSMPGMMETVLNIGLNDAQRASGCARQAGNERFAWDSYRRLIQMFGKTVLRRRRRARSSTRSTRPSAAKGTADDLDLDADDLRGAGRRVQEDRRRAHRPGLPAGPARAARPRDPRGLRLVERRPRRALPPPGAHPGRPRHRGQRRARWSSATSARTPAPASPSPATRPPARQGVYGDYLPNAQGEDVVAGIRNTVPLQELERLDKTSLRPS